MDRPSTLETTSTQLVGWLSVPRATRGGWLTGRKCIRRLARIMTLPGRWPASGEPRGDSNLHFTNRKTNAPTTTTTTTKTENPPRIGDYRSRMQRASCDVVHLFRRLLRMHGARHLLPSAVDASSLPTLSAAAQLSKCDDQPNDTCQLYAAVLIGRIMNLARPCVRPSVYLDMDSLIHCHR